MSRLAVIGGGAWGTALALAARRAGSETVLWARDPAVAAAINRRHQNPDFLPGVRLDPAILATGDLDAAAEGAEGALVVVPAQYVRGVMERLAGALAPGTRVLLCAKGIETGSLKTMTELAGEILADSPLAVLSGPSFAAEVARDLPTAVTIASRDPATARFFVAALASPRFRPYLSQDPVGAEIGGAVKNVLAIACGIVAGRGLGDNARAAMITRGLAEMIRLGVAKGARAETFSGLSGLGDLVLSCSTSQSRNHALGLALGRGESLDQALAACRGVVEGVATAAALVRLAGRLGIEMPIAEAVAAVLHRGADIDATIGRLLSRPHRAE
jgi:glycerol-3-phosphate dehydrogenase (NAD(P)+)